MKSRRVVFPTVEALESRIAPSALTLQSATTATYVDAEGQTVTVKFTKPILDAGNLTQVFAMWGDMLGEIDLTAIATPAAAQGTGISVTVAPGAMGDGSTTVGYIKATGIDVGAVLIHGDLAAIDAGDAKLSTPGLKSLTAQSIGRFGTTTGAPDLSSDIAGPIGAISVLTDVIGASIQTTDVKYGKIGAVTIGGSLSANGSGNGGNILAENSLGAVKIGGSMIGGSGFFSGGIMAAFGPMKSLYVGGSMLGNGGQFSARATGAGIGKITVIGSIEGGTGPQSGEIYSKGASITSLTVGGSIVGGASGFSGTIIADAKIGPVFLGGSLTGGSGESSGYLTAGTNIASVYVGGSVTGGSAASTGAITSGTLGAVKIGGDLRGGSATDTGEVWSYTGNLKSIIVGGSCMSGSPFDFNGCVLSAGSIGAINVYGDISGTNGKPFEIRAATGIASMTVGGDVDHGLILSGYSTNNSPANAASIGIVKVGGDWIASNLVAGAQNTAGVLTFGDNNDSAISATGAISKIASITIGGALKGTAAAGDHYGFVAQQIGAFKLGFVTIPLSPGAHNDNRTFVNAGDVAIHEV